MTRDEQAFDAETRAIIAAMRERAGETDDADAAARMRKKADGLDALIGKYEDDHGTRADHLRPYGVTHPPDDVDTDGDASFEHGEMEGRD